MEVQHQLNSSYLKQLLLLSLVAEMRNDNSAEFNQTADATDLLLGAVPQSSVNGVGCNICPVDVTVFCIPVQRHGVAHVGHGDDVVGHVVGVKADASDVRPSGKKQELVKT